MTIDGAITQERISKSASLLKQARPAYEPLIDFHKELYLAQEESKAYLDLDPITIESDNLKMKIDNDMPLIDTSQFVIELKQAEILLEKICRIAQEKSPKLNSTANEILLAITLKNIDFKSVFDSLIHNNVEVLKSTAKAIRVPQDELIFFIFAAISPAIQSCAVQLSHYLKPDSQVKSAQEELLWNKGYCPICGNIPQMAFLNQDGEKHLICSFCLHRWKTSRMGCTFCQNREKGKQHYFFNEEEKEYRVDLCDNCGKYLKVVDLRELTRDFYPPLEMICTLHLDMQATEQGYVSVLSK